MLFNHNIALIVLSAMMSLTTANPILEKREQKITVSYCNSCVPIGQGGVSCVQRPYVHWGDNNLGSCNDSAAPFNSNFCSANGNIKTPSGSGSFSSSGKGCNAQVDQEVGTINANGNIYRCYKANGQTFTNNCGATYACSVKLSCYGP